MKKIFYLISISLVAVQCSAQTRLTFGEIRGRNETFVIRRLKPVLVNSTQKQIVVYSKNNKYNNGVPYPKKQHFLPMNYNRDMYVNNDEVKRVVQNVLSNKLDALKQNKEQIDLLFVFKPNGMLTDITFFLNENTLINVQDIEKIDNELRTTIKATFKGREYLQYAAINDGKVRSVAF